MVHWPSQHWIYVDSGKRMSEPDSPHQGYVGPSVFRMPAAEEEYDRKDHRLELPAVFKGTYIFTFADPVVDGGVGSGPFVQ
jgi:hypothetical protein